MGNYSVKFRSQERICSCPFASYYSGSSMVRLLSYKQTCRKTEHLYIQAQCIQQSHSEENCEKWILSSKIFANPAHPGWPSPIQISMKLKKQSSCYLKLSRSVLRLSSCLLLFLNALFDFPIKDSKRKAKSVLLPSIWCAGSEVLRLLLAHQLICNWGIATLSSLLTQFSRKCRTALHWVLSLTMLFSCGHC